MISFMESFIKMAEALERLFWIEVENHHHSEKLRLDTEA